ncbi:hypothetical protein [Croceibacter atlanticus]|uniref:hypothetical protein n=1 Tax=Croceibacter atlanticus TaxID=313588 RepID=UPI002491CDA9|nr:hypothetical protein [Croceibacter atlanticus]
MEMKIVVPAGTLRAVNYLEERFERQGLNKEVALIYLSLLMSYWQGEHNTIKRPLSTYTMPEFDEYLNAFKFYNLIESGGSSNTYYPLEDLDGHFTEVSITDFRSLEKLKNLLHNFPELQQTILVA